MATLPFRDFSPSDLAGKLVKLLGRSVRHSRGHEVPVGSEKQFTSYNMGGWGYGPGWYRGGWYGGGMTTGQTSTIYTGALVIDMYNPSGHDLIWRGVASKTLDPKAKPEKREKNLNKALTKLFKNYPPKVKS